MQIAAEAFQCDIFKEMTIYVINGDMNVRIYPLGKGTGAFAVTDIHLYITANIFKKYALMKAI